MLREALINLGLIQSRHTAPRIPTYRLPPAPKSPRPPRCFGCARSMQLVRRTSRFGGLRDVYSFECQACGVWHFEEADALEGRPDRGAVLAVPQAPPAFSCAAYVQVRCKL